MATAKKKLDTIHAGNLEAHVKRSHSGIYHEIQIDKEKIAAKRRRLKEKNERQIKKSKLKKIKIDRKYLQDACLELVAVNARPFFLMEDTEFQKLINPVIVLCLTKVLLVTMMTLLRKYCAKENENVK